MTTVKRLQVFRCRLYVNFSLPVQWYVYYGTVEVYPHRIVIPLALRADVVVLDCLAPVGLQ